MEKFEIEEKIVAMLKTVYDPEIPVNVYDLGLIYKIDVSDNGEVVLDMTLTAPNCPAADFIMEDIRQKIESVEGVNSATINLVFEPEWDKDMMSEEARKQILIEQREQLFARMQEMQQTLDRLDRKIEHYEKCMKQAEQKLRPFEP